MLSYSFIIIFIVLSIYLANSFKNDKLYKLLSERLEEASCWDKDSFKSGKVKINGKELYFGIYSNIAFDNNVKYILICIQSKSKDFFEIRQTTLLEKLFVKIFLLKPIEKLKFFYENSIYIASDNIDFYDILSDKNSVTKINNFLQKQPIFKKSYLKLYNSDNEFCMKFSLNKNIKLKEINIDKILSIYGDEFLSIFHQLKLNEKNDINHYDKIRSKTRNLRFVLLLAIMGSFFSFIYNSHKVFPQIIDISSLIFLSILASISISIFVMLFIFKTLKNSSFILDIASKYTVGFFFACLTISYYSISYINIAFDTSNPKQVIRTVVDKRKSWNPISYYVKFKYIYSQSITGNELRVPYEIYQNSKKVDIYIKSGYLNIRYVDDIK